MPLTGPAGPKRTASPRVREGAKLPISEPSAASGGERPTVVVLAAGKGVRMRSRVPKVLHPVAGRPMLLWALAAANTLDPERTLVVTNPAHDGVQEAVDGQGETVEQHEPLGTGHALAQVSEEHRTDGPVLVLYGDTPLLKGETLKELLQAHLKSAAAVTLLTAEVDDPSGYGRIVRGRNGLFKAIVEEKEASEAEKAVREVNTGVYCFRGKELWPALDRLENRNRTGEYYLTDVVRLIKGKVQTVAAKDLEEVLGINDRVQLASAETSMRRRIVERLMRAGVTITDPASTFVDPDVVVGEDSVIHPFTTITGKSSIGSQSVIGPFSQLRDCRVGDRCRVERVHAEQAELGDEVVVGPFSRLRPGTRLADRVKIGTHAEVKNSSIGTRSVISHFSAVLDSEVGTDVNIGAGTVTANYDGQAKHKTRIGDRAQIGSDTILVAPVTVGKDAYTGAGSVITKDVPDGALSLERTDQRIIEGWTARRRQGAAQASSSPREVGAT